jgi:sugar phosphate permease
VGKSIRPEVATSGSRGQRRIFAVTWLTYAGFYFCRKNLSIALPALHSASGLGSLALANIVFGYSLLYALGQFGCGFLSDRFGPRRVVGTGLVLIVASNLLMGFHGAPLWLLVFACVNGIGQSTGWSGLVKIMASWFSSRQRGVVMAWWGTNYVLGGFLATAFATWAISQHWLLPTLGWRRGFILPAAVLAVAAVPFFLLVRDEPETPQPQDLAEAAGTALEERSSHSAWREVRALLGNRAVWLIGASYFFLEMCRYALMFWLPYYMVSQLHYGLTASGYLSSLYELVGVVGAVAAGYISDHWMQSRRAPVAALMLCGFSVVILALMGMSGFGPVMTGVAISLAGLLSYGPDTLLSGAAAQDLGQARAAATASGLIDGIGHLGALISPYLVIYVSEHYGWNRLFLVFAAAGFAAAGMLIPLWNLKPSDHSETIEPTLQPLHRELRSNA